MPADNIDATYEALTDAIADPETAAWVAETEMEPVAGPGTRVCPPTYLNGEYATADDFIPTAGAAGWLNESVRANDGRPVTAQSVVVDGVSSQSGRAEIELWYARERLGGLPGIVIADTEVSEADIEKVLPPKEQDPSLNTRQVHRLLKEATLSTWDASHRHCEAWIKFAAHPDTGVAIWATDNDLRNLICQANTTTDATLAFRNFPNAILYGFFLSHGTPERHRQSRIYSSEIIGYGARPAHTGTTKSDALPASKWLEVTPSPDGFTSSIVASPPTNTAKKASGWGFGMVPREVGVGGFHCETILQRASISLTALRAVRFADDPEGVKNRAAAAVLTVLGMTGHFLAQQQVRLRSGCDLIPVTNRYGLRRLRRRDPEPIPMPQTIDEYAALLDQTKSAAAEQGLRFAPPIDVPLSGPEIEEFILSHKAERDKGDDEKESNGKKKPNRSA